jgi:hypothetical protein
MTVLFCAVVPLVEEGTGGADLHALAAIGAGLDLPPGLSQAGDDLALLAPPAHIPDVGALHFIADPNATGAEDAAVVI